MNDTLPTQSFDTQAAWLRRFHSDSESQLQAFALRLRDALPELVTVEESRSGLFSRTTRILGVTVELGQNQYGLRLEKGRLKATIALTVRGITISTRECDTADWFRRLMEETRSSLAQSRDLSQALSAFMST